MLAPLVVLTILFGVYPKPVLDIIAGVGTPLVAALQQAHRRGQAESRCAVIAATSSKDQRQCSRLTCYPMLPELFLALGACVLLCRRLAAAGRPSPSPCSSVDAAGGVGVLIVAARAAERRLRRRLRRRRLRALPEDPGAGRLGRRAHAVASTSCGASGSARFEYPVLVLLSTLGMMLHDLGRRSDLALSGARTAEPGALRAGRVPPRHACARPKRASNISCWARCRPGMLLYGASLIYGFTGTYGFRPDRRNRGRNGEGHGARHRCSAWCS